MEKKTEARCMKCRKQVEIKDGKKVTIKARTLLTAIKGICPHCGTKVCRILGKEVKNGNVQ